MNPTCKTKWVLAETLTIWLGEAPITMDDGIAYEMNMSNWKLIQNNVIAQCVCVESPNLSLVR